MAKDDHLEAARREIEGIKAVYVRAKGWNIETREREDAILLYVKKPYKSGKYVLRLTCRADMCRERPRETFVNPENWDEEGPQFWPSGGPFRPGESGGVICIPGVCGFHEVLDRGDANHPPEKQTVLKTLLMMQGQLEKM